MLTFKRKLILTQSQASRLDGWMGVCRLVYNMCIEIRNEAYKNQQITIHRFALDAQLATIKDIDWIADVPANSLSDVVKRMDLAYKAFFKGKGFPKFASKHRNNSISFRQFINIEKNKIKIPKIGYLKMVKDSQVVGDIKNVVIKKEHGAYYACIYTDAVKHIQNQDESQILSLDMGTRRFYTDQRGNYCENPKHLKRYERQLRIENRSLSRKKRFGKNWIKQCKRLAKLHSKIGAVRNDFLHNESTRVAKAYHYVIMEDLNVSGMVKSNLAKHILDAGWGNFRRMLAYKTTVIPVSAKFTSQICSSCGHKDKESRISQAVFICTECGEQQNADQNAAKNILSRGTAVISQRKAIAYAYDKERIISHVRHHQKN